MIRFMLLIIAFLALCCPAISAEIAVIPYKIVNSSTDFPESTGGEYSRLMSVASYMVKRGLDVSSPQNIDRDLERMKLSPQDVITKEDLNTLGRTLMIDYFMLGSLSRTGGRYRAESVLYSVRDRKTIVRTRVEDADIIKLAEKDVREALASFPDKPSKGTDIGSADLLFLLDMSYSMNRDWEAVKTAVMDLSSLLIDTRRLDTRVHIVPFSDRSGYTAASTAVNSIGAVRNELEKLKPAGSLKEEDFLQSLRYAVGGVKWRSRAAKTIILISNSPLRLKMAEQQGITARSRGIVINAVSLGQVPGDRSEVAARLAGISGGFHAHAAYHQKLFDAAGEAVDVYMENGRLFRSRFPERGWKSGLYVSGDKSPGRPKSFANEIFFQDKKETVTPYTLPRSYERLTTDRIINQDPLENNVSVLVKRSLRKKFGRSGKSAASAGKALVSDGKISLWINVPDEEFMKHCIEAAGSGHFGYLGVIVRRDEGAAYGLTLVPVVKGLSADYIPGCLNASLSDIVRRGDYFREKGMLTPPVWFVKVKVEEAERSRSARDVRGR